MRSLLAMIKTRNVPLESILKLLKEENASEQSGIEERRTSSGLSNWKNGALKRGIEYQENIVLCCWMRLALMLTQIGRRY